MSKVHVFKTSSDELIILDEAKPNVLLNDKIPPSKLKEIYAFEADSLKEYIEGIIPLLFQRLKENPKIIKLFERLIKDVKDGETGIHF